jgi:hypothetical protein
MGDTEIHRQHEIALPTYIFSKHRKQSEGEQCPADTCQHPPVVALLTGEALQVVDVVPGPHDHLERRNHLVTRSAVARIAEQPGGKTASVTCYSPP